MTYAPEEKGSLEILVGHYTVAATADAAQVNDYAGDFDSKGGNYEVTYYIRTSSPFDIPVIPMPDLLPPPWKPRPSPPKFKPWATKRALPEYLK